MRVNFSEHELTHSKMWYMSVILLGQKNEERRKE